MSDDRTSPNADPAPAPGSPGAPATGASGLPGVPGVPGAGAAEVPGIPGVVGPLRHGRVIIAGWGPVGRIVAEGLAAAQIEVVIVELNLKTIETQLGLDKRVVYGDCCDPEVLTRAGITSSDALIVAIPDDDAAIRACRVARQLHPDIFIAARANFVSRGHLARNAGADVVIVEEVVTAQAMQQAVVARLLGRNDGAGSGRP